MRCYSVDKRERLLFWFIELYPPTCYNDSIVPVQQLPCQCHPQEIFSETSLSFNDKSMGITANMWSAINYEIASWDVSSLIRHSICNFIIDFNEYRMHHWAANNRIWSLHCLVPFYVHRQKRLVLTFGKWLSSFLSQSATSNELYLIMCEKRQSQSFILTV